MSDLISRQAAIGVLFSEPLYKSGMKKRDADEVVPAIYEKIKSLPSAQLEIIRCKDCKHRDADDFCTGRGIRMCLFPMMVFATKGRGAKNE